MGKRWLEDAPEQRLWFAAQAVADEMRARATAQSLPLSSSLDSEGLMAWYDAVNRTREALRGPLRGDLLLLELLGRWR
jgi:DNA polymerase-3 subunit delta'